MYTLSDHQQFVISKINLTIPHLQMSFMQFIRALVCRSMEEVSSCCEAEGFHLKHCVSGT